MMKPEIANHKQKFSFMSAIIDIFSTLIGVFIVYSLASSNYWLAQAIAFFLTFSAFVAIAGVAIYVLNNTKMFDE